jgi:hypothetical protein
MDIGLMTRRLNFKAQKLILNTIVVLTPLLQKLSGTANGRMREVIAAEIEGLALILRRT